MPVENPYLISNFYANYPFNLDYVAKSYQHMQNIKKAVKTTFPKLDGAITSSIQDINRFSEAFSGSTTGPIFMTQPYKGVYNTNRALYMNEDQIVRAREPLPPLGCVLEFGVTEATINSLYPPVKLSIGGPSVPVFVKCAGQDISGSRLQLLIPEFTNAPNMMADNRFPSSPKIPSLLNTTANDMTDWSTISFSLINDVHGETYTNDGKTGNAHGPTNHSHTSKVWYNNIRRNNQNGGTKAFQNIGAAGNTTAASISDTSSNTHNHAVTITGDAETSPINLKLNFFIRIN